MKDAKDVIPWKVTDISIRPYDGYWSFNPSIHFDGETWRCVLRCCDYAMPDGVTIRSKGARPTGQQTKNAMVILDPTSWRAVQIFKMHERDDHPRTSTPHVGYEDMRLFRTDKGGLQGIAAALHLKRDPRAFDSGMPQHQPPEQALLSFDENYDIVAARPIRGETWSGTPQKNWVPFDHCAEPRFLYSIDKGTMFDDHGAVHGAAAAARASALGSTVALSTVSFTPQSPSTQPLSAADPTDPDLVESDEVKRSSAEVPRPRRDDRPRRRPPMVRGGDVRIVRGGRVKIDAMSSRPSIRSSGKSSKSVSAHHSDDSTRLMGTGRILLPKYGGLRGGSQLVRVDDDAWLGIGHEMKFVGAKKMYWHTWYLVDSCGKMRAVSAPMKLAENGIEFAAGMAIDGDRLVVSFGVDDMDCRLGETRLSAVMAVLRPVER